MQAEYVASAGMKAGWRRRSTPSAPPQRPLLRQLLLLLQAAPTTSSMWQHTNHTAGMPLARPATTLPLPRCCTNTDCVLSSLGSAAALLLSEDGVDVAVIDQHVQVQLLHRVLQAATTPSSSDTSTS
jgi:hypothetical protein